MSIALRARVDRANADGVHPQHGQHDLQLLQEGLHVRDLRFRELPALRTIAVLERDASRLLREFHQPPLQVTPVTLRERVILAGDEHNAVPELLLCRVVAEPVDEVLRAADVAAHATDSFLVIAEEQVGAVPLGFIALEHIAELRARSGEHVARPAGDLRRSDPARNTLHEEQLDVLAGHAPASLKVSSRSR
ncbi:MAG: hypothetical protein LLG24_06560 [Actinomycetia bacterium]|nr:hypothetical protein [Actinomycetes bacterium]